jgi:glycyl-tRNA synthetase
MADATVMEKLVALCKRRGFIYPASEIYGGLNGFWDYGPLGVLLKNNIRDDWWRNMVECPPIGPDNHPIDMVGIDTAIIQHPTTWVASGHASGFNDPMVDCTESKKRYRADHLWVFTFGIKNKDHENPDVPEKKIRLAAVGSHASEAKPDALKRADKMAKKLGELTGPYEEPFTTAWKGWLKDICGPDAEKPGTLTEPRLFNLMFETYVGAIRDENSKAFLRPETAQGIFLNFKKVIDTTRVKVPFGVAQIGKSFRNEVTPRNFIFRSREFEQMEMEWFCHPDEALKWYEFWKAERLKWWKSLGVAEGNLKLRDHEKDELSHYSKMTVDIEYKYPFTAPDFGELEGIAHRGDFDLTQHSKHSGQKLDYFDQELQLKLKAEGKSDEEIKAKSRYLPNVIEPASGLTRAVLVLLCEAYTEDATRPSGVYLKFLPKFAPIKLGIFPLVNKDGMPEVAEKLYLDLRQKFTCEYDPKQSIGKRYARMDEIGTPFCVCVDGQTLQDQTVTIRHRDTTQQERIAMDNVKAYVMERL